MTKSEVLEILKNWGTAQNRKIYGRHGVTNEMYGVSFANLKKLAKKIKIDHTLAEELWKTANHNAQILATMIADPKLANNNLLEKWVSDSGNYVISDSLSQYVKKTNFAAQKMGEWTASDQEWIGRTAWLLLAHIAMKNQEYHNDYFEKYIEIIEKNIHTSKNRVKDEMNSALIAIGIRNDELKAKAITAAKRIG